MLQVIAATISECWMCACGMCVRGLCTFPLPQAIWVK